MSMLRNPAHERLERGEICLSVGVRHAFGPDIAKILAVTGFDEDAHGEEDNDGAG